MPEQLLGNVVSWATELEPGVIDQVAKTSKLPFLGGHVALMADAHVGFGSTVGSVIPTKGAIIPGAIGVDIGCGMVASHTSLHTYDLPDGLERLMPLVEQRIPAGVGQGHDNGKTDASDNSLLGKLIASPHTPLSPKQDRTVVSQFGTLGAGNHFVEVCSDENGDIWTVLHSGSRGIGNQFARKHIDKAKGLMKDWHIHLEDPDLAYLVQSDPSFKEYITDMLWAQHYAYQSRAKMNRAITLSLFEVVGSGHVLQEINCHHNFTQMEHHNGQDLWITRKGAIKAAEGDWGVIPGSMGTSTFITRGLGNPSSYNSSSHGAGRRMSRSQAKRELSQDTLADYMQGKTWNADKGAQLVDEHPDAYKDIDVVMANQADLTQPVHELHQLFNYKGTK
jgi:tRNA-splicing ligase RtcB (3'-phosphate/5'-hydroxy nucleic acid ligase)